MNKRLKIAVFGANLILGALIILLCAFFMDGWGLLIRIAFYVIGGAGIAVGVIFFFLNKDAIIKSALIILVIAAITLAAFIGVSKAGGLEGFKTDSEKIAHIVELIEATGGWGMFVYFLFQVLQVVIIPLPAAVCYIPGAMIWGPLTGTLLASAGVIVGSVVAYVIGRYFGKKAVVWIAGKETTEKYSAYFAKRGKVIFVIMQILPFFPDDILCMVAGLTCMNFAFFLATMVLVRPAVIAVFCYFGSGSIIPFSGWGIAVWIAIIAVCLALAFLSFKYQDKFENWLIKKFTKKKPDLNGGEKTDLPADDCKNPDYINPSDGGKTEPDETKNE